MLPLLANTLDCEDIVQFEGDIPNGHIRVRINELENGILVLITDSETFKLGPTCIATPSRPGMSEPISNALFVSGFESTVVRTIAERIAVWTKRTCLLVVHAKNLDRDFMVSVLGLLKAHLLD